MDSSPDHPPVPATPAVNAPFLPRLPFPLAFRKPSVLNSLRSVLQWRGVPGVGVASQSARALLWSAEPRVNGSPGEVS